MDMAEIASRTEWESGMGNLTLHVDLFGMDLPFVLFSDWGSEPVVNEKMAATVDDVLRLAPAELQRVKDMLWDEANFAFQVADYGVEVLDEETQLEAHLREFGISGPDDAYAKSTVRGVHVREGFEARFAELKINTGAENLIGIIVKDGRIIDWDDDGTHLGWFDEDEQTAAKKRAKVLA